ncbi:Sialin-like protein [Leptotrombidium deliense]|uniref:Sialin-like protein n=1 Tax=Leptotrombidium deliense TaxID=299467 RepID=A0A443SD90_9ACAR|nr:Sialin-like protein [Leptotrombidium deliense]
MSMSIRLIILILATFAPFIQVAQRYNMSIAIIAMVNSSAFSVPENNELSSDSSCPANKVNATREFPEGKLLWNPSLQGIILSAYFYGYTATQIIGGRWSERWGGKIICGVGVLFASIGTFLTPFTADYFILIFLVRLLIGAFHGFIYSSLYTVFNNWTPENERATAIGSIMAGGNLGGAIALPLVSYTCSADQLGGWPTSFYIIASIGFVWSVAWFVFMTDLPEKHPRISEEELKFIKANVRTVMASIVAKTTGTFSYYVLTTELPLYLENVLNVPIKENGFFNSYMYLVVTVSLFVSGRVADLIKSRQLISNTVLRKIFQGIGN